MALRLLLWKNFKLKQRQWGKTVAEIITPLVFILILVAVRQSQDFYTRSPDCQFKPSAMLSKGILPALQSFCFFGICQDRDTGYNAISVFNDSELQELNTGATLLNSLYTNPVLNKYRQAAEVLPADWRDPATTKQVPMSTFIKNTSLLFDNVTATADQQALVLNATVPIAKRLNLEADAAMTIFLRTIVPSLAAQAVCSGATAAAQNSTEWATVAALCNQTQFRNNVQLQFDVDSALNEMKSNDTNRYTLQLVAADITVLGAFFGQVSRLLQTSTVQQRVMTEFPIVLSLTGGSSNSSNSSSSSSSSSSMQQMQQLLDSFSKIACGSGQTTITKLTQSLTSGAASGAGLLNNITAAANNSLMMGALLPPDQYCYNQTMVSQISSSISQLLKSAGMSQLINLLFGEMLYFPDNNSTRANLGKVNETIQRIGLMADFAQTWIENEYDRLSIFMSNSSQVQDIRNLMTICTLLTTDPSTLGLCRLGGAFFAPSPVPGSPLHWRMALGLVQTVMRQVYYFTACSKLNKLRGFSTEAAMDSYAVFLIDEFNKAPVGNKSKFFAAVAFDTEGGATYEKYRLRMVSDMVDATRNFKTRDRRWSPEPRATFPNHFKYYTSFFIHVQELLEQSIAQRMGMDNVSEVNYMRMFPTPCFIQDQFIRVVESSLPMIMTLSWIYSLTLLVNAIVYEKESRLKEMMKIMGLSDGVHWLAWFITSALIMLVAAILMTIFLKAGQLIIYSNAGLLFVLIISFVVATIFEGFLISVFFSNSSVASAFAGVIFFVGYLPYTVVETFIETMGFGAMAMSCLVPQVAFGIGSKYIGQWELENIGVQTSNYFQSPISSNPFPFAAVILMLWFDSFLMMFITWYIEKVFPGQYGVPKPFYFPFTKSYWCGASRNRDLVKETDPSVEMENNKNFEEEPKHLNVGVSVAGLYKVYNPGFCACRKSKPFTAVNGLSYKFYEGQVTSFLGHNGAGKSTTVSILTGLYTPTGGTAYIYGYDIRTQMDQIRRNMGLCPQHNVLFNQLTVEDHIYFFGMLKGLSRSKIKDQIDSFVADVGLEHKRYEYSCNLSGGMKRKLSVAMAFVGDSKLIILDEPTAGVDPHARRSIWDVLTKFRAGRTIILTTHHMDEADILGDRICIINKGSLVCSGSPMFLKKSFGHGYTLTMVTSSPMSAQVKVLEVVNSIVSTASLGECTPSEINVKLPFNESEKFSDLFAELEKSAESLGIDSYGIEDCSLEEIFLSVTQADREETIEKDASSVVNLRSSRSSFRKEREIENFKATQNLEENKPLTDFMDANASMNGSRCATPSNLPISTVSSRPTTPRQLAPERTGSPLLMQVKALWIKRFNVVRRSKIGFLAEFLLPTMFILMSLALLKISPTDGDNPAMELAPWYMLGGRNPRASEQSNLFSFYETREPDPIAAAEASRVTAHFTSTEALGTRCVDSSLHTNDKFPCKTGGAAPSWTSVSSTALPNASNCKCSYEDYPRSAKCVDWPAPAKKYLRSADVFENLTMYNLTNYIQSTVLEYYKKRYGGYSLFINDTDPAAVHLNGTLLAMLAGNVAGSAANSTGYSFSPEFLAALNAIGAAASGGNATELKMQVWYENRGYVSGPAYLNTLHNGILRSFLPSGVDERRYGISGWTHPITLRTKYIENVVMSSTITAAITVISIIFALSFIPASFVLFLITERQTNAKHLQFVSGINPTMYWLVNHAWNMVNYLIPLTLLILLFVIFGSYEFVGSETIGPFIIIMFLFGLANAPVMYPFSWVMDVPSKAFTLLSCLNLGIGFVTTMSVTIIEMIAVQNNDTAMESTVNFLKIVFLVFPHFCLGQGLMELTIYYQFSVQLGNMAKQLGVSVASLQSAFGGNLVEDNPWAATQKYIFCLIAHSILYFLLVILMEYNFFCTQGSCSGHFYKSCFKDKYRRLLTQNKNDEDSDVKEETDKVRSLTDGSMFSLVIKNLVKIFHSRTGPKAAVRGINIGVSQNECFGFLGVNGAGKTTTFKMLTGDINPTSGDAYLKNHSILTDVIEAHKQLGYCPQFDALLPLLTGRETLELFARIRGINEPEIPNLVESIGTMVGMKQHLDKLTQEYSGGNKRKLSCGLAFIGNPPIVFLDEPTAGMDPGARRFLWRCIQGMVAKGSCVILTSHSMEDCQALCHRLTIMVNGQLKCIGSPQHLKTKFGQGFTVFLRLPKSSVESDVSNSSSSSGGRNGACFENPAMVEEGDGAHLDAASPPHMLELHNTFTGELPEATLREQHGLMLQYQVPQDVPLSRIFSIANSLRVKGQVEDYSVNQTTLDQVFINFAKNQTEMSKEEKQGSRLLSGIKRQVNKKSASVSSVRVPDGAQTQ